MSDIIKKKRGRKPKNFNILLQKNENIINNDDIKTEEEKIILHIPITINDINLQENNDMSLFIKCENNKKSTVHKNKTSEESISIIDTNKNVNKIITYNMNFNKNTKCWWCKNYFDSPAVQLPEDYYNETFFCIGHFCSFNCMKSYNLDINDSSLWKKESLINFLYYMTYNKYIDINYAPNWISLEEFGGNLTIEQFRENSIINAKEYVILHPPIVSRQMQIEESYKFNKLNEVSINKINKIYSDIDSDYNIKLKNPIQSYQLNLESTMGLIKKKNK